MGKIFWFVIIFILIGCYIIYSSLDLDLKNSQDRRTFLGKTFDWLFQVGKSTKDTVGYAAEQDWLPKINKTNDTEDNIVKINVE